MRSNVLIRFVTVALSFAICWMALPAAAQEGGGGGRGGASPAEIEKLKKAPTPHAPDGHPDLTGFWGSAGWGYNVSFGKLLPDGKTFDIENPVGRADRPSALAAAAARAKANPPVPPPYKPEFASKAKDLSDHWMIHDPAFFCAMEGFPRLGAPTEIAQVKDAVVFLYEPSENLNSVRVIPTDNRKHDPLLNPSYLGDSVGRWEGDTLVIDVTNMSDETWISRQAPLHSEDMHVVETLKREGDTIQWSVTIDDPKMLTKPITQSRTLSPGVKGGHVREELPCKERDAEHIPVK